MHIGRAVRSILSPSPAGENPGQSLELLSCNSCFPLHKPVSLLESTQPPNAQDLEQQAVGSATAAQTQEQLEHQKRLMVDLEARALTELNGMHDELLEMREAMHKLEAALEDSEGHRCQSFAFFGGSTAQLLSCICAVHSARPMPIIKSSSVAFFRSSSCKGYTQITHSTDLDLVVPPGSGCAWISRRWSSSCR